MPDIKLEKCCSLDFEGCFLSLNDTLEHFPPDICHRETSVWEEWQCGNLTHGFLGKKESKNRRQRTTVNSPFSRGRHVSCYCRHPITSWTLQVRNRNNGRQLRIYIRPLFVLLSHFKRSSNDWFQYHNVKVMVYVTSKDAGKGEEGEKVGVGLCMKKGAGHWFHSVWELEKFIMFRKTTKFKDFIPTKCYVQVSWVRLRSGCVRTLFKLRLMPKKEKERK